MHYPAIDPVIISLGPLAVRWYGLAYLAGFAACWILGRHRASRPGSGWTEQDVSDLVFFGALGAVLGGRFGYVLFYGFDQWLSDPLWLLRIWDGGMSFHGGLIGALAAFWWFGRRTSRSMLAVSDFIAPMAPLGLGFGRLGNFANTELPGRATESAFGLIFPCSAVSIRQINPLCTGQWETFARHPSALYQAFGEGLLLFGVLWWISGKQHPRGVITGAFLLGYGLVRLVTENFRQPDGHLGFILFNWLTMGQLLSLPMVLIGVALIVLGRQGRLGGTVAR